METEKTPPKMSKKLWNSVYYMTRKGISKSKLMLDFDLIKRAKTASKSIRNLMIQHPAHYYSTLSCRSDDVLSSFISPREYEFSCSNSPAYPYRHRQYPRRSKYDQRFDHHEQVFGVLNHHHQYYPVMGLPGLGNSPLVSSVGQLIRVTDSPFSVNEYDTTEKNHQVDRDAEKFINRFYKDLRNQRRIAAFQSPPISYVPHVN